MSAWKMRLHYYLSVKGSVTSTVTFAGIEKDTMISWAPMVLGHLTKKDMLCWTCVKIRIYASAIYILRIIEKNSSHIRVVVQKPRTRLSKKI